MNKFKFNRVLQDFIRKGIKYPDFTRILIRHLYLFSAFFLLLIYSCSNRPDVIAEGEMKTWHTVTITFNGPYTSEYDTINPFTDYRLDVEFSKGDQVIKVPGYYAADGNAAESSAKEGNKWRVHFCPPEEGQWHYKTSFLKGKNISVGDDPETGQRISFDGYEGVISIEESDKTALDFFRLYLPFKEMVNRDEITKAGNDFCLAKDGVIYALYLPEGKATEIIPETGEYSVYWYNPRKGKELIPGSAIRADGKKYVSTGNPPEKDGKDWVCLIRTD